MLTEADFEMKFAEEAPLQLAEVDHFSGVTVAEQFTKNILSIYSRLAAQEMLSATEGHNGVHTLDLQLPEVSATLRHTNKAPTDKLRVQQIQPDCTYIDAACLREQSRSNKFECRYTTDCGQTVTRL